MNEKIYYYKHKFVSLSKKDASTMNYALILNRSIDKLIPMKLTEEQLKLVELAKKNISTLHKQSDNIYDDLITTLKSSDEEEEFIWDYIYCDIKDIEESLKQ